MNVLDIAFGKDIVLDEEAFNRAVKDFAELGRKLQKLREDVEDMLETLQKGFDTPAGRQFVSSCRKSLCKPLDDQKLVLDHISESLHMAVTSYESVFEGYEELQSSINNI